MKSKPLGVVIFGVLLIVTSASQMLALVDYPRYTILFNYIPQELLYFRYAVSWVLRILGLASGIGILRFKEIYRKIGLALSGFTIVTIFWKHPYAGFQNHIHDLSQRGLFDWNAVVAASRLPEATLIGICVVVASLVDLIFAGVFIYYFTRDPIKDRFH